MSGQFWNVILRTVIPTKLRGQVLQELHSATSGMVRTNAIAQTHVWEPGIDAEIERLARKCTACALESKNPARYLNKTVAKDTGPFLRKMWLIAVDVHSERPKV